MVGHVGGGVPTTPLTQMQGLQQRLQTRTTTHPDSTIKSKATVKQKSLGFLKGTVQKATVKSVTSVDDRIASIDQRMQNLDSKVGGGLTPPKMKSRLKIFGTVVKNLFKKIPTALTDLVKDVGKLLSFAVQAVAHTLWLIPSTLVAAYQAKGNPSVSFGQAMKKQHGAIQNFFSHGSPKSLSSLKAEAQLRGEKFQAPVFSREGMDRIQDKFSAWYDKKVGITKPEDHGPEDEVRVKASEAGAENLLGILDEVSGYEGANVLQHAGDLSTSQDNPDLLASGNQGDVALGVGALGALGSMGGNLSGIEEGLKDYNKGSKLIKQASTMPDGPEKTALLDRANQLRRSGVGKVLDSGFKLTADINTVTNLLAGSSMLSNTSVGNFTDASGACFSAVSKSVEATVETVQAVQADRKIGRCNEFLKSTASIDTHGNEVIATKNVKKVRDSVMAYKKNNKQTRGLKIFGAASKFTMAAASIVGAALFIAAVSNPIGWIVGGVGLGVGIGVAVYKGYKAGVRASQNKGLEARHEMVTQKMERMAKGLAKNPLLNVTLPEEGGSLRMSASIDLLKQTIHDKINADPPPNDKDLAKLQAMWVRVDQLGEMRAIRRDISSALKANNGGSAIDGLKKALNDPSDPEGQEAAAVALKEVFKMDPALFKTDPGTGRRLVGDQAAKIADKQLLTKFNLFHSSVYSKN